MRLFNIARFRRCVSFVLFLFGWISSGSADELLPYEKRELFDFEQCADMCQIQLDKRLFSCMPYRKDQEKQTTDDCGEVSSKEFDYCMSACPVDPRLRR